ncbi:hypothetical protein Cob_v008466 [Colletotrichum orbiculare MAFF 240422]|uniref:Uncharacterized protein n=1 Tax=Colletotrichum orbiculare (strain 104-T / ATCC 96160 / CBS 514.97 / LARS 414 / MAFF 240422) TaxID=1213857 RepID=N4US89_COLOR|nr:hypothetical protein Cob_v008466 [Colletotrichum orbiculare MAFF 240422]
MARLPTASSLHAPGSASPEKGAAELNQLLRRLDQSILHADQERERRLRASEFERARLNSNLEYARSLLTRVEQETLHVKLLSRRQDMQVDLNRKRDLLERLFDRMHDFEQLHEEDDSYSSDGEDILADIIPTPSDSMDSRSTGAPTEDTDANEEAEEEIPNLPPPAVSQPPVPEEPQPEPTFSSQTSASATGAPPPTTTSSTLRARGPNRPSSPNATSTATARAALFARRNTLKSSSAAPASSTATAEAILDHQRVEQDQLSESILKMAGALKASSQRFSNTLEQDKNVLSRAGEGMEKTENSMDAASRRMGTLRKMTEGKGWWGRMILYAWVYGLMVALVLLVFVMPKLRF